MRTPINKESFEDRILEKNKVDINLLNDGFFLFTKTKITGILETIGIIRCEEAY